MLSIIKNEWSHICTSHTCRDGYIETTLPFMPYVLGSVVLYGCETWSLTFRKERRLRVFDNRVLRRIFGPSRDEVTGEWRKLLNEELNDLYCSPNIVRVIKSTRIRWAGHVARLGRGEVIQSFGGET